MKHLVNSSARSALATVAAVAVLLLLGGCNTVKGVGQDLQKAGEKLEEVGKKK